MKIQDDRCLMDVRVVGYQFPDRVSDKRETVDYDANWLTVSVRYTGTEAEKVEDEFWMRVCFVCEVDKGERKEITAVQRMDRERLAEILDEVKGVVQRFPKR